MFSQELARTSVADMETVTVGATEFVMSWEIAAQTNMITAQRMMDLAQVGTGFLKFIFKIKFLMKVSDNIFFNVHVL